MASSGIEINAELKDEFNKMKQNKLATPMELLVMQLSDDKKSIIKKEDFCKESCTRDDLLEFLGQPELKKDCCYMVFDYKKKLTLIKWAPDTAPASKKMIYASTFSTVKTALDGCKNYIEASELDDFTESELAKTR